MHFFYDAQGRPAIVRYNGMDYAYLHNLRGDIVSILDMEGNPVVQYGYNAWGKPVSTEGSMAGTLGQDNPFRYRGYVWDAETGLYYLRSRYYEPSWGRFINADALVGKVGAVLSHNVFAYCYYNPIDSIDPEGKTAIAVVAAGSGLLGWILAVIGSLVGLAATLKHQVGTRQASNSGGAIPLPGFRPAPIPGPIPTAMPTAMPVPTTVAQPIPIPYAIATLTPIPRRPVIFPANPYDFKPLGLIQHF